MQTPTLFLRLFRLRLAIAPSRSHRMQKRFDLISRDRGRNSTRPDESSRTSCNGGGSVVFGRYLHCKQTFKGNPRRFKIQNKKLNAVHANYANIFAKLVPASTIFAARTCYSFCPTNRDAANKREQLSDLIFIVCRRQWRIFVHRRLACAYLADLIRNLSAYVLLLTRLVFSECFSSKPLYVCAIPSALSYSH